MDSSVLVRIVRIAGTWPLCAALLAGPLHAQAVHTFRSAVDDSDQPYAVYVPRSFEPGRRYPLVISLHAEQSTHRTNLRQVFGLPMRLNVLDLDDELRFPTAADAGYIVACPLARGTMGYEGVAETDVYDVLADVERRYPVDRDRVYLTGISMGGAGVLRYALTRPDVWAAVAAIAPAAPRGVDDLAGNALHVPVRLYHAELDPIVKPEVSRAWHRRLLDAGAPVEYIEYPGVRHNAWDFAYRNGAMFEWLSKFRRDPFPARVRFTTRQYRYAQAYWVTIDALTPGAAATIDAARTGAQAVQVQTAGVEGFTLVLDQPASVVAIDGTVLRVKASATLSFHRSDGAWRAGRGQPAGKKPGAEGPIAEALTGRQIYVYGTLGAGEEEIAARRNVAAEAAAWSSSRARLGLNFAVKADSAVTAADLENADVILFGTRDTNSLIARFGASLPIQLNPGAADYGLLFIAPIGRHYALVSSGRPWLSGAGEWESPSDSFSPLTWRILSGFGDYVLFKGSIRNVVAEGRFTNSWKVAFDAAPALLNTGTVTLH